MSTGTASIRRGIAKALDSTWDSSDPWEHHYATINTSAHPSQAGVQAIFNAAIHINTGSYRAW